MSASDNATFDPLALALPERTHPQWAWRQCRFASVMSYRLAQIFLRDAFPGGRALGTSTLKATIQTVGERLEQEVQRGIQSTAAACQGQGLPTLARDVPANVALQVDAGYIRSAPTSDGTRWFAAVASKIVHADPGRTLAHAYSIGYDPWAGLRQQAFLGTAGISLSQPVVVLSDGGEDIAWACKLPAAKERGLDWFHIGMRFQHPRWGTGVEGRRPYLARPHQAVQATTVTASSVPSNRNRINRSTRKRGARSCRASANPSLR